ncbi:CYP51A1 [Bugula neritina]|uniref:CYP51A1 n=1 Tax=Bugula neritina TaxID=10212 RepID=A0A7J7KMN8_BUGNE|nr:CYP51A1 [Bugula neritina]
MESNKFHTQAEADVETKTTFSPSFSLTASATFQLAIVVAVLGVVFIYLKFFRRANVQAKDAPPFIPSQVPFLGSAIEFNKNPVDFLIRMKNQYGPVFTIEMAGKKFTYLMGNEASSLLFNSKNEDLNAEDVYAKLVTPVFGKGVAYDVPNDIFLEQKKMFKTGLNIARFKEYVPIIEQEVRDYLTHLFEAFSEMIVMTASHCLHGPEIRSILDERVAHLYYLLDQGFCPEAWLLPSWLHFLVPKLRRRDAAHVEMKKIFYAAIEKRRASGNKGEDMLQTLLDTPYKSGRYMTDDEIAGMLIGLLMAGQHTSSSTSSWLGVFLAHNTEIQRQCYEEQCQVRGTTFEPVDYDQLKSMRVLDNAFRETLRLRPPIHVIIRHSRKPLNVCGYTIPANHSVCVSPTANQRLTEIWGGSVLISILKGDYIPII